MKDLTYFIGKTNRIEKNVRENETALVFGSGDITVFSTPHMIGLMENAALTLVEGLLDEGSTTVGIRVNVKHMAATPIGMKVGVEAKLIEVDRKRLVFNVTAWDEKEKIGEGIHERFIVNSKKFMGKALSK
ncbi:MAG: thioesterase family protein [Eubacteriales bacterium]